MVSEAIPSLYHTVHGYLKPAEMGGGGGGGVRESLVHTQIVIYELIFQADCCNWQCLMLVHCVWVWVLCYFPACCGGAGEDCGHNVVVENPSLALWSQGPNPQWHRSTRPAIHIAQASYATAHSCFCCCCREILEVFAAADSMRLGHSQFTRPGQ